MGTVRTSHAVAAYFAFIEPYFAFIALHIVLK